MTDNTTSPPIGGEGCTFKGAAKFDLGNYRADFDETITNRCSAYDSLSPFLIW